MLSRIGVTVPDHRQQAPATPDGVRHRDRVEDAGELIVRMSGKDLLHERVIDGDADAAHDDNVIRTSEFWISGERVIFEFSQ